VNAPLLEGTDTRYAANFSLGFKLHLVRKLPKTAADVYSADYHKLNFTLLHDCLAGKQMMHPETGLFSPRHEARCDS